MSRLTILGLPVDALFFEEVVKNCDRLIHVPGLKWAVTLNPEIAVVAQKDKELRRMVHEASLVTADGSGLLWAASYLSEIRSQSVFIRWIKAFISGFHFFFSRSYRHKVIPGRVTGVDLVRVLLKLASHRGYRVFLLGGKPGVAELLRKKLFEVDPRIKIVGATDGFRLNIDDNRLSVREEDKDREHQVLSEIQRAKPHLLLVAFGPPKQERWIFQHQKELRAVKLAIGVGGTFDFLAGKSRRAPRWMRSVGLEFLWRLFCEPKRFRRMITTLPKFIKLIVNSRN